MSLSKQEREKVKNLWKAVHHFLFIQDGQLKDIYVKKISAKAFKVDILDIEMMLYELQIFVMYLTK